MAPASPTAVLAVPDRPLAERPDTKGAEAPGGQFAGLMAQIKPAPRPEPRHALPKEAPSKEEPSPTETALAAANAAQTQAAAGAAQAQTAASADQAQTARGDCEPKADARPTESSPGAAPAAEAPQDGTQASTRTPAEPSEPASPQGTPSTPLPLPAQVPSPTTASAALAATAAKNLPAKAAASEGGASAPTGPVQTTVTTVIQSDTGLAPSDSDAAPLAAPGLVQAVLAEADAKVNPFKASLAEGRVARMPSDTTAALKEAEPLAAAGPHPTPIRAQVQAEAPRVPFAGPHAAEPLATAPRAEAPAVDLGPLLERASAPGAAPSTPATEGLPFGIEGAAPKLQPALTAPGVHQPEAGSSLVAMTARAVPAAPAPATAAAPPPVPAGPPPNAPMAQVEGSLRWMLKGGAQEARLQLHPESLGQVTIHLKVEGGEVHARLWITEPASVQAVQEGRPHLEQSLREQGLQLGSFDLQQGHRPFQEAPGAPAFREAAGGTLPIARQEAPVPLVPSILTPHHVELYA